MVTPFRPSQPGASRFVPALLAAFATVALVGFALPTSANHAQQATVGGSPFTVEFDHDGDNEWWVEFQARTSSGASMHLGEVLVEGTTLWRGMNFAANDYERQQQGWAKFAPEQSFQVPAGKRVMFRVHVHDAAGNTATAASCWFTHPAGVEQCSSATPTSSSGTTTSGSFDAPFTAFRGNEWWVQAQVGSNGPAIAKVDVRIGPDGAWKPLTKQNWGTSPPSWAASYHFPQGSILQMRATATDGRTDLSSCRQWIPPSGQDAAIVPCPGTTPPPPPGFDATFSGVKGNNWWVQVNVAANQPVAQVAYRVDCASDWIVLPKQSWGGYAISQFIPTGAKVDFQARTSDWASDVSGGYLWTDATPANGCPQGDWPRQHSDATYQLGSGVCGGGECFHSDGRLQLVYDKGRWIGTCTIQDRHTASDGTVTTRDWSSSHVGLPPSWETPRTRVGAEHKPDMFRAGYGATSCSMGWTSSPVIVHAVETVTVDFESQPARDIDAWAAASRDEVDNLYTTHWDKDTGLVLEIFSNPRRSGQGSASMVLVDSDVRLQ